MAEENGAQIESAQDKDQGLRASLEKAFDDAEKDSDTSSVSEAGKTLAAARKTEKPDEKQDTSTTGEDGAQAKQAEDATQVAQEDDKAAEGQTEAPQHWPAQDREMFGKQPKEVQGWLLNRHKAMEADYTRKTQEIAPMRRMKEGLDEIFAPFKEKMALDGVDEIGAIKQLVAAHSYLQRDPGNAIQWLAQQYGIDLKTVGTGTEEGQPGKLPPEVDQRFAKLEQAINGSLEQQKKEAFQSNLTKVEQFAGEKDSQGKPLHPYFDDVAEDVAKLLKAGYASDLQDAYDRATYANPQVRAKVLAASEAERRVKDEAERKKKAAEAKQAGFDVKGEGSAGAVQADSQSLRSTLERAWDAQEGRV